MRTKIVPVVSVVIVVFFALMLLAYLWASAPST